jgi:hypothetical protein
VRGERAGCRFGGVDFLVHALAHASSLGGVARQSFQFGDQLPETFQVGDDLGLLRRIGHKRIIEPDRQK